MQHGDGSQGQEEPGLNVFLSSLRIPFLKLSVLITGSGRRRNSGQTVSKQRCTQDYGNSVGYYLWKYPQVKGKHKTR